MRAFLTFLLLPLPALAASATLSASGTHLEISGPCAATITIDPDPTLAGRATLVATADHQEEIAQLQFSTADRQTAKLTVPAQECWHEGEAFRRTLTLAIRVPPRFPISIEDGGDARYTLGAIGAPLNIDAAGALQIDAASAAATNLTQNGSGTITIGAIAGPAHIEQNGSGSITIRGGTMPALSLESAGSGTFRFTGDPIGNASLDASGNARITIDAPVGTAAVDISGSSQITIARVTGPLARDISGTGELHVLAP